MGVKTDARFTQAGLRLCAALILATCVTIVSSIPTPALPSELPSLVVETRVDDALLARTRRLAESAPSSEATRALDDLIAEAGRREAHAMREGTAIEEEERRVYVARRAIVRAHGASALRAMRARAVLRMVREFDATRRARHDEAAAFGGFRTALIAWRAVVDDDLLSPPLVVRALFAARWNVICRLPPTSGMGREERRAYHGWFALHAESAPIDRRIEALRAFASLGRGRDVAVVAEAFGTLSARLRDHATAAAAFDRAAERLASPRLRNYARTERSLAN